MRLIVTILFIITSFKINAQSYVFNWTGSGHSQYQIQQTIDTLHWNTIGTISSQLTLNNYKYTIPGPTFYYRIKADNDSTKAILVPETLSIKQNNVGGNKKIKTSITKLSIKVNMDSRIHYTIESPRDQLMTYSLYDIQGRKLTKKMVNLHYGQNDFFDSKPKVLGVYYGTFEGYFDFKPIEIINE